MSQLICLYLPAPPAPQPAGIMNNGAKDVTKDIQKLQQQLQDIKDQVGSHLGKNRGNNSGCRHIDIICAKLIKIEI